MGFQSSFNQLLATASAGYLGLKHIQGQEAGLKKQQESLNKQQESINKQQEALDLSVYNTASNIVKEEGELESGIIEQQRLMQEPSLKAVDKSFESENYENKAMQYVSDHAGEMTKAQRRYARSLLEKSGAAKKAYDLYQLEADQHLAIQNSLRERQKILQEKKANAPEAVRNVLGKVGNK